MKILALDTGYKTGYAIGMDDPATTIIGTAAFAQYRDDYAEMGSEFSWWLNRLLTEHEPSLLVLERPFFRGAQTCALWGLVWEAHRIAQQRRIDRREFAPIQIRKHTGFAFKGLTTKQQKDRMIEWAVAQGYAVTNDHEADAAALLSLAGERLLSLPIIS